MDINALMDAVHSQVSGTMDAGVQSHAITVEAYSTMCVAIAYADRPPVVAGKHSLLECSGEFSMFQISFLLFSILCAGINAHSP